MGTVTNNTAGITGSSGQTEALKIESNEYTSLVRNINRAAGILVLKKADNKTVGEACGTESLDIMANFWDKIHKTDDFYKSFVQLSVYPALLKVCSMILKTDKNNALQLNQGGVDTSASSKYQNSKTQKQNQYDKAPEGFTDEEYQYLKEHYPDELNSWLTVRRFSSADANKIYADLRKKVQPVQYNPNEKTNEAMLVQQLLQKSGINVPGGADGVYGSGTAKAVIEFQKKYADEFGLTVCDYGENGELVYVDVKTLEAMYTVAQRNTNPNLVNKYGDRAGLDLEGTSVENKCDWLEWGAAQYGFHEVGENGSPFGQFTNTDGQAWCAAYVSWCLFMSGDTTLPYTAVTWDMRSYAIDAGIYKDLRNTYYIPEPGDVFYEYHGKANKTYGPGEKPPGHVGFISSVVDNGDGTYTIKTMEGNSSDKVTSHEYRMRPEEFMNEWQGIIVMNRDDKIPGSGNIDAVTEADTGQTR